MGLESVELVMAWEEEFNVEVPDAIAEKLQTPGDLICWLMELSQMAATNTACPSMVVFHQMRKVLCGILEVPRSQVRPMARLEDLFPLKSRATRWEVFRARVPETGIPGLVLPSFEARLSTLCHWTLFLGPMAFLFAWLPLSDFVIAGPVWSVLFVILAVKVSSFTNRRAVLFPSGYETLGALAREVSRDCLLAKARRNGPWDREYVAKRVREITLEQTGLDADQYREDARFIDDMGID